MQKRISKVLNIKCHIEENKKSLGCDLRYIKTFILTLQEKVEIEVKVKGENILGL